MTFIVVGSTAARYHLGERWRDPKDFDVFMSRKKYPSEILDWYWDDAMFNVWHEDESRHATLDELYTIKLSHAYWELKNGSWNKHMTDAMLLKREGAVLMPSMHKVLYGIWERDHGKKTIDLNQDKAMFFDDAVKRTYDHDSIHYSVSYEDDPVYTTVLKDNSEVAIDMNKVKALPFDRKVQLYREEVYATALERIVIPKNYMCSPNAAYSWALRRTITRLTKGWSATFMADNFEVFRKPDVRYVDVHKSKAHKLIPIEGKVRV